MSTTPKKNEPSGEEMVSITKKEYSHLLDRAFKLECLENGGVDNWEWYGESMKPYFGDDDY